MDTTLSHTHTETERETETETETETERERQRQRQRQREIDLHRVSIADVFAGGLDDRLAGLVEGPVDAVVGPGVGLLNQGLELKWGT